jgi:expansin
MVGGQWGGFGLDPDGPDWRASGPDGAAREQPPHRHRRGGRGRRGGWRGRWQGGRRWGRWSLFGLGVTGAGLAAVVVAVAVGLGQVTAGRACAAPLSGSALYGSALSGSALSGSALSGGAASGSEIATHYVLQGLGNCSYPAPANGLFVALSPAEYDSAAACGGYLEVTGPDGSVTVQVIDQCPPCATGHIDLSETAFARLAPLSAGLISVSYGYLVNPALPGPVTAEVKQGSSQYWLALLFDNTGNPLASVQVETASGWLSLSRASYNYWIAPSGAGNGPFTVRLTDTQGHQVTIGGITLSPGTVQDTGAYMYGAGSTSTVAPAPPAAASPSSSASPPGASSTATASATPTTATAPAARRSAAGSPAAGSPAAAGQHEKAIAAGRPSPPPSPPPTAPPTC